MSDYRTVIYGIEDWPVSLNSIPLSLNNFRFTNVYKAFPSFFSHNQSLAPLFKKTVDSNTSSKMVICEAPNG